MIAKESDALELADRLDDSDVLLWSPMVRWEATAALARLRIYDVSIAHGEVHAFGTEYDVHLVSIGQHETDLAIEAHRIYGKGSKHPAHLNMGDCFAYACAKAHQAKLLYKGNDFIHTDLA